MRFVTFKAHDREALGALVDGDMILDLQSAVERTLPNSSPDFASMQQLIESGSRGLELASRVLADSDTRDLIGLESVRLLSPLPHPVKIRDCFLFTEHAEALRDKFEKDAATGQDASGAQDAEVAKFLTRSFELVLSEVVAGLYDPLSVSGHDDVIEWPNYSSYADFELELGLVIGRTGINVTHHDARSFVFGITLFNDWSARDELLRVVSAGLGPGGGKEFDGSNSLGPCIATPDEFSNLNEIDMAAFVNGEELARGSTRTMRYSFEDAIVALSAGRSLHAGEVLGSGTVLGGCLMEHGRRLADGDVVELRSAKIGTLRNTIRLASAKV